MVVYQRLGVIILTVIFTLAQEIRFQFYRLFVVRDYCKNYTCVTEKLSSGGIIEDVDVTEFMYKCRLVSNLLALLPCVCLAAWSDRHGRKLLLVLPLVGLFISDVASLIILLVPSAPIVVLIAAESVYGFCGGTVLIVIGCLSYITDATDHRVRTRYFAILWGLLNLTPLVDLCLQQYFIPFRLGHNFRLVVLIGIPIKIVLTSGLIIYVKSFVSESVFILGSFQGNPWKNLITPINVSDTVNCVFKRRLDNIRFYIISLFAVFIFYSISLHGTLLVIPLYLKNVFHWSNETVLLSLSIEIVVQLAALWLAVFIAYQLRFLDSAIGTAGSLSLSVSSLILAFSNSSYIAVAGLLCGALSLLIPATVVSMLSKLVERVETGCLFAAVGFLMLISQLIAAPSYQVLYHACLEAAIPQLVFLLTFGLAAFGLLFFIYLRKNIAPDLLGHLDGGESLTLINRRGQIEGLF